LKFRTLGLFILIAAVSFQAQSTAGSITGRINDPSEAAVPLAEVVVVHTDTRAERQALTNSDGLFTFPLLAPGGYQVTVRAQGFRPVTRPVQLLVGQTMRVDLTLELGAVAEAIEVSGVVNQIQTENSRIVVAVTNKMVDELPLVVGGAMRSPLDLALITPETNRAQGVGDSDTSLRIGGGQAAAYGATLDGVTVLTTSSNRIGGSALNTPSVDAITEFSVESNGFKAEFGHGQGGTITFSSKSGTNELHGTAYEFLRNNALDTRRFFEDNHGVYKQHDFGWSLGGPVHIPKIYNGRSKTFFFASMEWFRNRIGATSQRLTVPTEEMYRGDFSRWVDTAGRILPAYDPATTRANPAGAGSIRTPFPGNLIPNSRFAALSTNILKIIDVRPNVGAAPGASEYVRDNYINTTGTQQEPANKFSAKIDHNFSGSDRASFLSNFGREQVIAGPDGFPGLPGVATSQRASLSERPVYRASYAKVISASIVNNLYGGNNGYRTGLRSPNHVGGWKAKGICIGGVQDCDATFPQLAFSDYTQWGGNGITGSRHSVYSVGDDLTVTPGKHTLKAGYLYERLHYYGGPAEAPANRAIAGWLTFDRRSTSVPNNNNLATGGGNSFASFLLGNVFSGLIESD